MRCRVAVLCFSGSGSPRVRRHAVTPAGVGGALWNQRSTTMPVTRTSVSPAVSTDPPLMSSIDFFASAGAAAPSRTAATNIMRIAVFDFIAGELVSMPASRRRSRRRVMESLSTRRSRGPGLQAALTRPTRRR